MWSYYAVSHSSIILLNWKLQSQKDRDHEDKIKIKDSCRILKKNQHIYRKQIFQKHKLNKIGDKYDKKFLHSRVSNINDEESTNCSDSGIIFSIVFWFCIVFQTTRKVHLCIPSLIKKTLRTKQKNQSWKENDVRAMQQKRLSLVAGSHGQTNTHSGTELSSSVSASASSPHRSRTSYKWTSDCGSGNSSLDDEDDDVDSTAARKCTTGIVCCEAQHSGTSLDLQSPAFCQRSSATNYYYTSARECAAATCDIRPRLHVAIQTEKRDWLAKNWLNILTTRRQSTRNSVCLMGF